MVAAGLAPGTMPGLRAAYGCCASKMIGRLSA